MSVPELALLALLMLRGAQTPGELRQRGDRLHSFATVEELEALLGRLAERRMVVHLERRPGQKEARWGLGELFADADAPIERPWAADAPAAPADDLLERIGAIERDLDELRSVVAQLRSQLA